MKSFFFVFILLSVFLGIVLSGKAQIGIDAQASGICLKSRPSPAMEGAVIRADGNMYCSNPHNRPEKISPIAIENKSLTEFKYAQLLDRNVEELNNISLFNFIDQWWEARYHYGGHTKKGIDCSAFTGMLFNDVYHIRIPRTAREQFRNCEKIGKGELSEGDLVFFNTRGGISHVGCYLGDGYFVHASTGNGVTISNLSEEYYATRFISGGRVSNYCANDICLGGL